MTAPPARKRSIRGALTCVAMFAFGGAVLWGLYRAPRSTTPASPGVPWAAPSRPVRFVSVDAGAPRDDAPRDDAPSVEAIVAAVRPLEPDFVLLQRVRSEDAVPLAEGLGMRRSFHPRVFRALGTRPRGPVGCLVLSKHPLYDARPLQNSAPGGGCFGVWAVSVVEGSRFAIVSARLSDTTSADLARAWTEAASPPTIAGVGFEKGPARPTNWHDLVQDAVPQSIIADGSWAARGTGAAVGAKPAVMWVTAVGHPQRSH